MERKKKLRTIQAILLLSGIIIIYFAYSGSKQTLNEKILSEDIKINNNQLSKKKEENISSFSNIEYSGFDLAGNRYILKSKEAFSKDADQTLVNMKFVEATFFFKNDKILKVQSDFGKYNNKTLDMSFSKNVKFFYDGSELFAQKAEYSNSKGFLTISKDITINDVRGTISAENLLFDLNKQTLDITSSKDNRINGNIVFQWKRF